MSAKITAKPHVHDAYASSTGQPSMLGHLPRRQRSWRAIGLFGLTTLILGSLAILAAVGFLTFLWMASMDAIRGRPTPRLWNMIVEPAWTARAVTLSSVLLRS